MCVCVCVLVSLCSICARFSYRTSVCVSSIKYFFCSHSPWPKIHLQTATTTTTTTHIMMPQHCNCIFTLLARITIKLWKIVVGLHSVWSIHKHNTYRFPLNSIKLYYNRSVGNFRRILFLRLHRLQILWFVGLAYYMVRYICEMMSLESCAFFGVECHSSVFLYCFPFRFTAHSFIFCVCWYVLHHRFVCSPERNDIQSERLFSCRWCLYISYRLLCCIVTVSSFMQDV